MLENQEIESLMKDVVRYERTIGDLIERNEHLSSEVSRLNAIQLVAIDNKQNSIGSDLTSLATILFRMNEQQGRQFDNIYNLLAEIIANPVLSKSTIRDLVEAKHHSSLFSETITRIVTGQAVETLSKINVQITETTKVRALRGKLIFDQTSDDKSRAQAVLQENTDNGVHSLIFPVLETSATGFRGLRLEIKPQTTRSVRIRIRQIDAPENISEVNIDLHSLKYAHFNSVYDLGKRDIVIRSLAGGWIQVLLEASLSLGAGPVEIELIALNSVNAKSSQRIGTGRNAFGVRSLQVLMSSGLNQRQNITGAANDYIESSQQVDSKIVHEISMPAVEKVRSAKRHEYLQSGAYKSLTKFRNCHAGKRAFIIGNGPSINGQDLTLLKDEITFATNWFINHPNFSAINPDYYCVSSHEMFGGWGVKNPMANPDWLSQMKAKGAGSHKFLSYPFRDQLLRDGVFSPNECDFLLFDRPKYQVDIRGDINLDLTMPMDDGYTGIVTFCLPLAHYMGISEIYLVGCDCDYGLSAPDSPKSYFYDFSQHKTTTTSYEGLMRVWADDGPIFKTYEVVRKRFEHEGIKIINCTDGGRLEVFPRARFEDVVGSQVMSVSHDAF